MVSIAVCT